MKSILDTIAEETGGKSFKTYKYAFEGIEMPHFAYDEHQQKFARISSGETLRPTKIVSLQERTDQYKSPLFRFFLDGSRRTYKVDDMSYQNRVFPIIAGQVCVGCCERENKEMKPYRYIRHNVISLPAKAKKSEWEDDELCFENLRNKLNESNHRSKINKIIPYKTDLNQGDRIENRGIAAIQNYMVDLEKYCVAKLVEEKKLFTGRYLLKDGTLEYQVYDIKNKSELAKFKNNYQFVVGASKSFNPESCKDQNGKNFSHKIAELPLYYRTPVQKYQPENIQDMDFAVWYVRIRDSKYTTNAFDGILKLEKILVTDNEIEHGLESEVVDMISVNIINERFPVCYGADKRWANHLYPIYVTECYAKSKYLGENSFLNLFD